MKKLLLITYSPNDYLMTKVALLNTTTIDDDFELPLCMIQHGFILTPFETDFSVEYCTASLKTAGCDFLLFDITNDKTFGMKGTNVMAEFLGYEIKSITKELNEELLFQKIKLTGVESLTEREREFMDNQFKS